MGPWKDLRGDVMDLDLVSIHLKGFAFRVVERKNVSFHVLSFKFYHSNKFHIK